MYYFAHIALRGFYAAVHRTHQWPDAKPLVIHRDKSVLDLNPAARNFGIAEGMGLREAKTMLADSSCLVSWEPESYRAAWERWLDVVCEFVDAIESPQQHEAILDLTGQPDPAEFALAIAQRIQKLDIGDIEVGLGTAKWMARLAAKPIEQNLDQTAIQSPAGFLDQRRIEDLLPIDPEHRRRLRFLGYRTIGDVAAIPIRILKGQFGDEGTKISIVAKGQWHDPFQPNYPLDKASARLENPEGYPDWQALHRAYETLAKRLRNALKKRDACSRNVAVEFTFESAEVISQTRKFQKPIATAKDLKRAMIVLTPQFHEPIVAVVVRLHDLQPIVRKQRQLDGTNEIRERKLSAEQAFKAIRTVYGDRAIQTAAEIEISRRARLMRAWKDATGWR